MTTAARVPQPGDLAPDFATRNQFGAPVDATSLSGRTTLLVFFPWAFSGICTGELTAVRDAADEFEAAGVRVLAIACDAMFTLRAFAEVEDLPFELLTDHWPHGELARAYGVFDDEAGCALRGSFVVDPAGRISWSVVHGIGEARDIAGHLTAARAATAANAAAPETTG